ncbi:hypothetical protein ACRALDRAFT_206944 [Sodiomyces alcalophilus JCM 7366]|uniref:uncharacterized protein n=1 Tax=Sodiomyces alcalophilus JCM 7366 TaxID=591952 RepID=UPI0039B58A63
MIPIHRFLLYDKKRNERRDPAFRCDERVHMTQARLTMRNSKHSQTKPLCQEKSVYSPSQQGLAHAGDEAGIGPPRLGPLMQIQAGFIELSGVPASKMLREFTYAMYSHEVMIILHRQAIYAASTLLVVNTIINNLDNPANPCTIEIQLLVEGLDPDLHPTTITKSKDFERQRKKKFRLLVHHAKEIIHWTGG